MFELDQRHILDTTESVCPVCMQVIEAKIIVQDGSAYMYKTCPIHGPMIVYLWPDEAHYNWMRNFRLPTRASTIQTEFLKGCPFDCGLCSAHTRHPTVAEVEVTYRCNLRCPICFMSASNVGEDPSLEQLEGMFASILKISGPQTSLQLTGGEPTIREDLPEIVRLGRAIGFQAIETNTNGVMIAHSPDYLERLVDAGITGMYLQFDGFYPEVHQKIRGADLLMDKLLAIENCRAAGIQVVLAMTIVNGINQDQIGRMLDFALENLDTVAGLALQPAFSSGRFEVAQDHCLTMGDVIFMLAEQSKGRIDPYDLWPLGCSHPLCSCGTHLLVDGDTVRPITRVISEAEYRTRFNPDSPQGSVFADILAQIEPQRSGRGLSVVIMNYMDAWSLDLKRLKECSMTECMTDGRLIPFCAYQLTDLSGKRIYPPWGLKQTGQPTVKEYAGE
jgi:7,8-dihydro-6-hydroxymethylpterin dimethyltransferase